MEAPSSLSFSLSPPVEEGDGSAATQQQQQNSRIGVSHSNHEHNDSKRQEVVEAIER